MDDHSLFEVHNLTENVDLASTTSISHIGCYIEKAPYKKLKLTVYKCLSIRKDELEKLKKAKKASKNYLQV